jgi:hypothetical protein
MKNIYFFIGLPRAGNTLLANFINQSKNLTMTANSITPSILYTIECIRYDSLFNNFPDHNSLDNVLKNTLQSYYKDWKTKNILDRGPWGTPANLEIINRINKDPKFVVLYRPVHECVASFVRIEKPTNIEEYVKKLLNEENVLTKNIWSINNLIKNKIPFYKITYEDIILNTKKTVNGLFNYLDIDSLNINYNKIRQLNINGVSYDDKDLIENLHTIRTDKVKKDKYNVKDYLNKKLINLCNKFEVKF